MKDGTNDYLIFDLYGPMASWGDVAVGTSRPSSDRPSLSGMIGLIEACLGLRRGDEEAHNRMVVSYGMAIQSSSGASLMRDYHTVQMAQGSNKKGISPRSTALTEGSELNTLVSNREYYCDSIHCVLIWEAVPDPPYTLEELAEALRTPCFVPYLGRKSCPISLPMGSRIVKARSIREAIELSGLSTLSEIGMLPNHMTSPPYRISSTIRIEDLSGSHRLRRRDVPVSRDRWQFKERWEYNAFMGEDDVLQ